MAQYRDINDLLLNTNKGVVSSGRLGHPSKKFPNPGDGVMVSVIDRGLLNILIHYIDPDNLNCRGETTGSISTREGQIIFNRAEYVAFSYMKIAGIHRQ